MQIDTAQELLVTSDPRFLNLNNTAGVCCWPTVFSSSCDPCERMKLGLARLIVCPLVFLENLDFAVKKSCSQISAINLNALEKTMLS